MRKSISIPKWYENNRLKYLRKKKDITQTQVADNIKCVLKTYQNYEQGHNFPTLEYATKLADLYNVSIDYLLGKSDYTSITNETIGNITGLTNESIEVLQMWKKQRERYTQIPSIGADTDALNAILGYEYEKRIKSDNALCGWSIFHYIKQYLSSGSFKRQAQDRVRFKVKNNDIFKDFEIGDTVIKSKEPNEKYIVESIGTMNKSTNKGSDTSTVEIENTNNHKECYTLEIDSLFESYSKDNLFRELDKIKEYMKEKR